MKYLKTQFLLSTLLLLIIASCSPYKSIEVSKTASNVGDPKTLIYSLPKTRVDINVQVTKTTTIAGPYAAYAEKYLSLTGVATSNVEAFEISNIKILPVNEPDPEHFYAVSFKNYPSNLDKLFSMTQQGLMLNLEDSWKSVSNDFPSKQTGSGVLFETRIREPNIKERVDTFYKTILTDASFVKVPIYKKSVDIKTEEQKAEDIANLILKIRKRRLKLMMGEYEFHPEGAALKVIVEELGKQEEELMSNFIGKKIKETFSYSYSFSPAGPFSKELLWFSEDKGVSESSKNGLNAVSVTFSSKESQPAATAVKLPEKLTNSIYFRAPEITSVNVRIGNKVLAEAKVPIFQTGAIQQLPVQ